MPNNNILNKMHKNNIKVTTNTKVKKNIKTTNKFQYSQIPAGKKIKIHNCKKPKTKMMCFLEKCVTSKKDPFLFELFPLFKARAGPIWAYMGHYGPIWTRKIPKNT